MQRFSVFTLARNAWGHNRSWQPHWRSAVPDGEYDLAIVGGGAHGLATAYFLAQRHGMRKVAVIEKGWIGADDSSPTILTIRPDTVAQPGGEIFELTRKLYRALSRQLNFNIQFSSRGVVGLCFDEADLRAGRATMETARASGTAMKMIGPDKAARAVPGLGRAGAKRLGLAGALYQPKGGMINADAVAWALARAADAQGVDIVQNCTATSLSWRGDRIAGVETSLGPVRAKRVALAAGAASAALAQTSGIALPLAAARLRTIMSQPVRPFLNPVITAPAMNIQIYQATGGEVLVSEIEPSPGPGGDCGDGGGGDASAFQALANGLVKLFPDLGALQVARSWSRPVCYTYDGNPLVGRTQVTGLYLNCGWGAAAFQAAPVSGMILADAIAGEVPHEAGAAFLPGRLGAIRIADSDGQETTWVRPAGAAESAKAQWS
ncbi:MAG: FAD-dependent oxidoreductase [Rhodobiaceae bacterium]|nr:FAD-dependent oxidoreductase [Rhodobiaceae bacterium]